MIRWWRCDWGVSCQRCSSRVTLRDSRTSHMVLTSGIGGRPWSGMIAAVSLRLGRARARCPRAEAKSR